MRHEIWDVDITLNVISSAFYACAKQMFTSVFTNKCRDTSFGIVNFSRFLFITCARNKTFSEEIEERRRDIPHLLALRVWIRDWARGLFTLNNYTSCNFIRKVFQRTSHNKMCLILVYILSRQFPLPRPVIQCMASDFKCSSAENIRSFFESRELIPNP